MKEGTIKGGHLKGDEAMVPMEEALEIQIPEAEVAEDPPEDGIKTMLQEEVVEGNKTMLQEEVDEDYKVIIQEEEDKAEEVVTTIVRTLTKVTFNVTIVKSMGTTATSAGEDQHQIKLAK